jgi:hypothetical protein
MRPERDQMSAVAVRTRFWVEMVCAVAGAALFVLTLVTREWIELLFRVDPDGGSGTLELAIALGLLSVSTISAALARREWRWAVARATTP